MLTVNRALLLVLALAGSANAVDLRFKDQLLSRLVESVPGMLRSFDRESGRFGTGIWICRDQEVMYPLAVAYATPGEGNRYFRDADLLDVIVKAGDPLIKHMDADGRWVFAKKDGSTWGQIWMPWTYSRWVRTFALIRDDMPPESRAAWTIALTRGYSGISRECLDHVHNIPTHHAMGLYIAGTVLEKAEWCEQAVKFLHEVVAHQAEGGYWSEGEGPVVVYDFVYVDALGTYFAVTDDREVFPALEKAALFHQHFTYPGGQNVETIDQRNPFHETVAPGNVGFTFTPAGRAFLNRQWSHLGEDRLSPDLIASLLLYGEEGEVTDGAGADGAADAGQEQVHFLCEGGVRRAAVLRRGPWFICLSAFTTPVSTSRWIQDRQNLVSIWHDNVGLILGGGNTKLQPAWSTFTVGDQSLLPRQAESTEPDFLPAGALYHVPSAATLAIDPEPGLDLTYGPASCQVRLRCRDSRTLEYALEAAVDVDLPIHAHLTLLPHMDQRLATGAGETFVLDDRPIQLSPQQVGGRVAHAGYSLRLPSSAGLCWPVLPHNPYRKDGRATAAEGRIAIEIPLTRDCPRHVVVVEVGD